MQTSDTYVFQFLWLHYIVFGVYAASQSGMCADTYETGVERHRQRVKSS